MSINYKALFSIIFCFQLLNITYGQLDTLTAFPENLQFYARDIQTNKAIIPVAGQVASIGDSVSVVILRNGQPYSQQGIKTSSLNFELNPQIDAELAQYTVQLYVTASGMTTLHQTTENVVAGDVYIISGQSNAQAIRRNGSAAENNSEFIRVFGLGIDDSLALLNQSEWFYGEGDGYINTPGNTGQWGLHLAKQIIDNQQIPVAVFNGARGAKQLSYFLKDDTEPENLNTNYGRLLYRLNRTKLADKARAIFWYQGESDVHVNTSLATYRTRFTNLYEDWLGDYPNVEKIYITQIRNGCHSTPQQSVRIQEALRQLAEELPDATIVSTKGLVQHWDACHFPYVGGYKELGRRYYQLINRDFYGENVPYATSPDIKKAAFLSNTEIIIETKSNDNLIWENEAHDYFVLEGSNASVVGGYTNGNAIRLQLDSSGIGATGITYLDEELITSPYVINEDGQGLVSFYNFPIATCIDVQLHAWLEGPYDPALGEMSTTLSASRKLLPGQTPVNNLATPIPAGQPYHIAPWNYAGTEGTNWTDTNYVGDETDWILVSFRSGIEKNTEVAMTAGLLKKDGRVEFVDRCALTADMANALYIVVEHRNHIGVMTPQLINIVNNALTYDFRLTDSYRDQTSFGQKQLATGEWVMFTGDGNQNDMPSYDITGQDKAIWEEKNGVFDAYLVPDFNLDGDINGQDKILWSKNNGISSRVPK